MVTRRQHMKQVAEEILRNKKHPTWDLATARRMNADAAELLAELVLDELFCLGPEPKQEPILTHDEALLHIGRNLSALQEAVERIENTMGTNDAEEAIDQA